MTAELVETLPRAKKPGKFTPSAMVLVLLVSVFSPVHLSVATDLGPATEHSFTANNTDNDSTIQTLISNLNMDDPAEVTGVVDHLNRVHVVWVEAAYSDSLNYALFDLAGYPLISTTEIPANSSLTITNPAMVVDNPRDLGRVTHVEI